MVLNPKAVLLALWALLLSASYQATAYPELFVVEQARDQCSNHPTRAFGKHKAPTASSAISITVAPSGASTPVTSVCPGQNYTVSITFDSSAPTPAKALITTSIGTLSATGSDATTWAPGADAMPYLNQGSVTQLQQYVAQCPGRYITPYAVESVSLTLGVPADATGSLAIQVTAARSESDAYRTTTATAPVLTADGQQCASVNATSGPATVDPTTTNSSDPLSTSSSKNTGAAGTTSTGSPSAAAVKSSSSSERSAAGWLSFMLLAAAGKLLF